MARCIVQLNNTQKDLLRGKLALSDFAYELRDYYQGLSKEASDISVLSKFINDEQIPKYFKGDFKPQDLVDFLHDPANAAKLTEAIGSMLNSIDYSNPQELNDPDYIKEPGDVLKYLRQDALNRISSEETNIQNEKEELLKEDSSSEGSTSFNDYKHQFLKKYNSIEAYRIGRFKGSATTEIHLISKFINDVLVKNALINTDTKTLVSAIQIPGVFGEGAPIDYNLKQYRKQLMKELVQRLDLHDIKDEVSVKIDHNDDSLFEPEKFNDTLKLIEQSVISVKHKGENVLLSDEGKLVEIANELKKTNSPELQKIIDNYVDHIILADYNKLFDYYSEGTLKVADYNEDFDETSIKYSLKSSRSIESANVNWTDRIHNAIELSPELYKTIMEVTPMLSYTTGEPLNEYLYSALVAEVMSKYDKQIDPKRGAKSVKNVLIRALNDKNNSFQQKNVLYTIYKKFFEEQGDRVHLLSKNTNKKVSSFLDTVGNNKGQGVMNLILKPLQETKKVHYAEVTEIGREPAMAQSGTKQHTVSLTNVRNDISTALNKANVEDIDKILEKYSIVFKQGSLTYKTPGTDLSYELKPTGGIAYDKDTLMNLSKDLLGIDFEENNAHKEFLQDLESRASGKDQISNQYLAFLNDALKVLQARKMLFDPEVKALIADKGIQATIKGSEVLTDAIKRDGFNTNDLTANTLVVRTIAANNIYEMLSDAENRYAGNRVKATVLTPEGTTVAGFSTHTLFLGLAQTHSTIREDLASVNSHETSKAPLSVNPFILDPNLLVRFEARSAIKLGSIVKPNPAMNEVETMTFNIDLGYFDRISKDMANDRPISPMFDILTYSDKTTNYLPVISNTYLGNKLFVDSGVAVPEDVTRKLHFDAMGSYYRAYGTNIIDTWHSIYSKISPEAVQALEGHLKPLKSVSSKLAKINELNSIFWNDASKFEHGLTGFKAARYYADKAGVALNNWVHYQNNGKSMLGKNPPLITKSSLIDYIRLFDDANDRTAYNKYMDNHMLSSVKELKAMNYSFNTQASRAINQLHPNLHNSFKNAAGQVFLTANNRPATRPQDINPAFRKYINDFNFIAETLKVASVGNEYSNKGDTPFKAWTTQNKRNVMATASMRKYMLGLENGVENSTRTAFIDDFVTPLKTILGEIHNVVDLDGASLETITQRIKTWNSLNSTFSDDGGPDHKSIFTHIDSNTGETGLTKHAAFLMDYDMIRNSIGADVDLMELHKKLYSTDVSKVDVTSSYRPDVNLSHHQNEPVYYWDRTFDYDKDRSGHIYKLESIEYIGKDLFGESTYTIKKRNLSHSPDDILVENNQRIKTMFDLWKIYGHIDSIEPTNEKTGISYQSDGGMEYFKPSITSGHKLLAHESYMGNGTERMLPVEYITGRSKSDVTAWKVYNSLFHSNGVVDSHISLIKQYASQDASKFEVQSELQQELGKYDVKVNSSEFLKAIQENKKILNDFFSRITDRKAAKEDKIVFDSDLDVPYQRFKGKNIDRVSFAGAQKLGQFNMNDVTVLSKKARLSAGIDESKEIPGVTHPITHQISNLNGGVQLNAWHQAEESTVTAPTQMLNALIFNGKSIEDVSDIYKAIGDIVDTNLTYALADPDLLGKQKVNIPQMVRGLSNSAFYAKNKETLLKVFQDMLKQSVKDNDFTLESVIKSTFSHANLPIDDPHIFNSAVADLANYFTKNGIRINFDGIFSILAPSSGILQFHDVKGGILPIKGINGNLEYRTLDPSKVTTLNKEDFKNWINYKEHLAKNNIHQNDNSYYRGQVQEPIIDADGNLHLTSKRDPLYEKAYKSKDTKGVSMTTDMQRAFEFGEGQYNTAKNMLTSENASERRWDDLSDAGHWLIQIDKDLPNEILEEAGEVKILTKDALIIPKGKFKIKNFNEVDGWNKEDLNPLNSAEIVDHVARDLKGQQITLQYADGRSIDLSVLRKGQEHLIPEAEALSKVKDLISTYKSMLSASDYKGQDAPTKLADLADAYETFKDSFNDLITPGSNDYDKRVHYVVKKLNNDYLEIDPTAENANHIIDYIYDRFSNNKPYRDITNTTHEANNNLKELVLSREYEFLDKLNQVGKAFLGKLQGFLDEASLGIIPHSLSVPKLFEHQDGLNTAKVVISRAEVVAPLTAKSSFLLREGDNIGDIDEHFFLKRLNEKLDYHDVDANAVLISKFGRKVFLHEGKPKRGEIPTANTREIDDTTWYTDENGNPQFIIPKGVTLVNTGGQLHAYVWKPNAVDILKSNLQSSVKDEGDSFKLKPLGNTKEERAMSKDLSFSEAQNKAKIMWNSWQKYLQVIGTRIPGQHFQSFQGLKIVGFTEGNKIHVPNEVTLLSGSDFDIDKQNVIYHSINKDGSISLWHPAARYDSLESIEKSMRLPLQSRRQISDFAPRMDSLGQPIDPVSLMDDGADLTDLDELLAVYKNLKDGFRFSPEKHPNILAALVHYDNWTEGKLNPEDVFGNDITTLNNGVRGIKNFAISRTNATIENPSNFIYLSKPVSFEVPSLFADNSPKGESAKNADPHKPNSIASAKLDNMVGKKVIGIMATGLKVFSAVSLTYNNELRNLGPIVNELNRLKGEHTKLSVDPIGNQGAMESLNEEISKYNRQIDNVVEAIRLDTTPLSKLRESQGLGGMDLLTNLNYDKISADVLHEVVNRMDITEPFFKGLIDSVNEGISKVNVIKKYLQTRGTFEDDAAEIMSQLLSAATDNAKELILGKINASPDMAGMYATMLMLKIPFEQIVKTMTSTFAEMTIKKGTPNVFDRKTSENSISNLLTTMANAYAENNKKLVFTAKKNLKERYNLTLDPKGFKDITTSEVFTLEDAKAMQTISDTTKEIALLGRMLSINQGVKSNSWDLYKFKTSIEDHVRKLLGNDFDFKQFLDSLSSDRVYANDKIQALSAVRPSFNILYVLSTNPHFAEQLKAYNAAHTILQLSSYKVNSAFNIVQKLRDMNFLGDTQNINENQYKDIEKFVENTILENFIDQESQRPRNLMSSPVFYNGDQRMTLTTEAKRRQFADWVRTTFEPNLKEQANYRGNDFVQGLTIDSKPDPLLNDKFSFIKLKVDTTNAQSIIQKGNKESFTYGLKLLYDSAATDLQHEDIEKQNNIVNTLFWYNLVLNKNSITKNSYAKMLGEVMGLNEGKDNPYRRLLEFKGNIGKNERSHDIPEGRAMIMSNGVTFDIMDLFKGYDSFVSRPIERLGSSRRSGDIELDDFAEDMEVPDNISEDADPMEDDLDADGADSGDMADIENFDDTEGEDGKVPKVEILKSRKYGEQGTLVTIKSGDKEVFKGTISAPSSLIPHSSSSRSKYTFHTDYNPLSSRREEINDQDVIDYQKMLHLTMHDLLSNLADKLDIQIIQKKDGKEITSKFDPTHTYECI